MLDPKVINWFFSGSCNLKCKFCYGSYNEDKLSLKEKRGIVDKIKDAGSEKLTITGGEPLLAKNLKEIIDYAKNRGLFVSLHTNGVLLDEKKITGFKHNVGRISLPLEGISNKTNCLLRNYEGYFDLILDRLEALKANEIPIAVKTVATNLNIHELPKMVPILEKYKPTVWLISQFVPEGRGLTNKKELSITDSQFVSLKNDLKDSPLNISFRSVSDSITRPNFFIDSNGNVFTSGRNDKILIGNIFEDEVIDLWQKILTINPADEHFFDNLCI